MSGTLPNDEQHQATGARSILVVHGRDFKPAAESLMNLIDGALRAGITRDYPDHVAAFDAISKTLAYYGDLTNELLESKGVRYDEALDMGDRNNALNSLRGIPERKRFGIRQYDCLPGKSALPEFLADVAAPVLGAVGLTMPLIASVSKDFHEYLAETTTYAEQVRERVRKQLCDLLARGDRVLLLTHGTGSAIACDVLWQLSHDQRFEGEFGERKIDTWVTMGAPLGDDHIRKRLIGSSEPTKPSFPANVISWHNVAAEDDYTCHDHTVANDYKGMMRERMISAVKDYRVYNLAVRYGKSNPHSSVGYYIHPRISKIVVDWLQAEQPDAPSNCTS